MKKLYALLFALTVLTSLNAQNQYAYESPRWYIGSGVDTAYLVIDFQTAGTYDPPSSFIYGVTFDDSITGLDILNLVASNDENLTVGYNGSFVDSIALGSYNGKNGVNGFYWGTWSDTTSSNRWFSNSGTGQMVYPNNYYGLSYTDFNPAIKPDTAVAVNNTNAFTKTDIEYFVGTGNDTAVFVVDFLDDNSYAWGYLFNDSTTANQIITDISAADDNLTTVVSGSFLNDISYNGIDGLAGMPNYWNTWSAKNNGIWYTNIGLSQKIYPNDWFGCSYPDFPPAIFPNTPSAAEAPIFTSIQHQNHETSLIYPNPSNSIITIETNTNKGDISILDLSGRVILNQNITSTQQVIDIAELPVGVYTVILNQNGVIKTSKLIKK